jgi:hypothetical protein
VAFPYLEEACLKEKMEVVTDLVPLVEFPLSFFVVVDLEPHTL